MRVFVQEPAMCFSAFASSHIQIQSIYKKKNTEVPYISSITLCFFFVFVCKYFALLCISTAFPLLFKGETKKATTATTTRSLR